MGPATRSFSFLLPQRPTPIVVGLFLLGHRPESLVYFSLRHTSPLFGAKTGGSPRGSNRERKTLLCSKQQSICGRLEHSPFLCLAEISWPNPLRQAPLSLACISVIRLIFRFRFFPPANGDQPDSVPLRTPRHLHYHNPEWYADITRASLLYLPSSAKWPPIQYDRNVAYHRLFFVTTKWVVLSGHLDFDANNFPIQDQGGCWPLEIKRKKVTRKLEKLVLDYRVYRYYDGVPSTAALNGSRHMLSCP